MKNYLLVFAVVLNICVSFSQTGSKTSAPLTQTIHLSFLNTAGDSLLQAGVGYVNAFGESFTVRAFKYYISNLQLQYADGHFYKTNASPHLVNEADSTTRQFAFDAPQGIITAIHFLLGVDSSINMAGVQTGDLDPAKGMYWVWNTGYIMAKLDRTSAAAKSPGRQFTYDIGGYKKDENAARSIMVPVPSASDLETSVIKNIIIKADVLKWFAGAHDIKIAERPMCHEPGTLAMQIADNYEKMFSIKIE